MSTVHLAGFAGTYFTSQVPDVNISVPVLTSVKTRVTIAVDGEEIFNEVLWPVNGSVTLSELGSMFEPIAQNELVIGVAITSRLMDEDDNYVGNPTESTATVLYSRADVGITALEFYNSYFLSILMGTKITAHGRLEYLHYYGDDDVSVLAEYADGTTRTFEVLKSGGTTKYTQVDVSPDYYELPVKSLVAYTVTAGNRHQRFEMDLSEPDCAPILEFYNSFGVWELLYCTGKHRVNPEYKRSAARINGMLRNYKIEETRKFEADTGILNTAMANWADDLFRSDEVYVVNVINGSVTSADGGKQVIITDSKSEVTNEDDDMPRFTFTYQYAQRNHNVLQMNRVGRIFDNTFDSTFN